MADVIKALFEGDMPTSQTKSYTVPTSKYAVVKSAIICNTSTTDSAIIRLIVGGAFVVYGHTLKPNATLVLDELDIPQLAGDGVTILSSKAGVSLTVTGFERDYVVGEYPYAVMTGEASSNSNGQIVVPFNCIIRSIIVTNESGVGQSTNFFLSTGITAYVSNKVIAGGDTLLVPMPKIYLPVGRLIAFASSTTYVSVTFVFEKVGD